MNYQVGNPPSLDSLPTEILTMIFTISRDTDTATGFLPLMRVCRRFQGLVEPLHYQTIRRLVKIPSNTKKLEKVRDVRRFATLLENIAQRPQLGLHVLSLSLSIDMGDSNLRAIQSLVHSSNGHSRLLKLLPCLRDLHLDPPPLSLDIDALGSLQTLRLDFGRESSREENTFEFVARHLWIPTLRTIHAAWVDSQEGINLSVFPPDSRRTSSVSEIYLHMLHYEQDYLAPLQNLLLSVKSLQRFTFESETDGVASHVIEEWLSMDRVALTLLEAHADTLEELVLAATYGGDFGWTSPRTNLMGFTALKRLGIPASFLDDHQGSTGTVELVLPPQLEELQLQFFHLGRDRSELNAIYGKIGTLVDMVRTGKLPQLKRIVWWNHLLQEGLVGFPHLDAQVNIFVPQFQRLGISVPVSNTLYFRRTPFGSQYARYFPPDA